jgi:hypothetical protein
MAPRSREGGGAQGAPLAAAAAASPAAASPMAGARLCRSCRRRKLLRQRELIHDHALGLAGQDTCMCPHHHAGDTGVLRRGECAEQELEAVLGRAALVGVAPLTDRAQQRALAPPLCGGVLPAGS